MFLKPELNNLTQAGLEKQRELIANRIQIDQDALANEFGQLGQLISISEPQSDLHEDFSAVRFVQFENRKLVYKPRSLRADETFYRLMETCFASPKVEILNRVSHGWMAFLKSGRGPSDFHLGETLSLLTVLRSADHHDENVLVYNGRHVFIDLECCFAPEMTFASRGTTAFSPLATRALDGDRYQDFQQVRRGYLAGLSLLGKCKDVVLQAIDDLKAEKMRVIVRQTRFYQSLMEFSLHPELLSDPQLRAEAVLKPLLDAAPAFPEIAQFEADRICRGIIPKFVYDPCSDVLEAGGERFTGLISHPGWNLAREAFQQSRFEDLPAPRPA